MANMWCNMRRSIALILDGNDDFDDDDDDDDKSEHNNEVVGTSHKSKQHSGNNDYNNGSSNNYNSGNNNYNSSNNNHSSGSNKEYNNSSDNIKNSMNDNESCYTDDFEDLEHLEVDSTKDYATKDEQKRKEVEQVQQLAQKETNRMHFWRTVVLILLIVTGVIVATLTYLLLTKSQDDDFVAKYNSFVNTIEDAMEFHIQSTGQAFRNFADVVTISATLANASFPYYELGSFEVHGSNARQAGAEVFAFCPLVTNKEKNKYEAYVMNNLGWVSESRALYLSSDQRQNTSIQYADDPSVPFIYVRDEVGNPLDITNASLYAPVWQVSPPPFSYKFINYNAFEQEYVQALYAAVEQTRESLLSPNEDMTGLAGTAVDPQAHELYHEQFVDMKKSFGKSAYEHPHSLLAQPVFEIIHDPTSRIVGLLLAVVPWDRYFSQLLPKDANAVTAVLHNTCGQSFTYTIWGTSAVYEGKGDLHNTAYDSMQAEIEMKNYQNPKTKSTPGHCVYSVTLYPTDDLSNSTKTKLPFVFVVMVAFIFLMTTLTFFVYDRYVRRRNKVVVDAAARSNAVVSSLFPSAFRDGLFEKDQNLNKKRESQPLSDYLGGKDSVKMPNGETKSNKPNAALFPHTTLMFADIAGFTAWSSEREPCQVFELLESLFKKFDQLALRHKVYKVETVGDCYVAAAGVPEPCKDHAVNMARFARDCVYQMNVLTKKLEVTLGPDTADLALRTGLHSGPVTAGILRGERSRFQLFGDTMNTASRMESTGLRNRIQISQETADLLVGAGKSSWIKPREDLVHAKGKGEMKTYWLDISKKRSEGSSTVSLSRDERILSGEEDKDLSGSSDSESDAEVWDDTVVVSAKISRLIDWNVDLLSRSLKSVLARRLATPRNLLLKTQLDLTFLQQSESINQKPIDEKSHSIYMANFFELDTPDHETIDLEATVQTQLYDYVASIASMYKDKAYHNFEHASHVTMSSAKLLSRIIANESNDKSFKSGRVFHNFTYGISSDPLAQFACIFGALVHDVDHPGVSNEQLISERSQIAFYYQNQSVSEQNSFDLAWKLFMDDSFRDFRTALCPHVTDVIRFRQLVLNIVLATDQTNENLKLWREDRWVKAFTKSDAIEAAPPSNIDKKNEMDLKATLVLEYLVQASNVSHTMQHWFIYQKWNNYLYQEVYQAYQEGRSDNPSNNWYENQIQFFDNYILPLAKKLEQCGVFGVSSNEYSNYALNNYNQWKFKGKSCVKDMTRKLCNLRTDSEVGVNMNGTNHSTSSNGAAAVIKYHHV